MHGIGEAELGDAGDQRVGVRAAADQHEAGAGDGGEHLGNASTSTSTPLTGKWRATHTTRGRRSGIAVAGGFERGALELLDVDTGQARARRSAPGGDA